MIYTCCNEARKALVLLHPTLNGIDYLEVLDSGAPPGVPRQQVLLVHCLNPLSSPPPTVSNVLIEGGESITNIGIDWVMPAASITSTSQPKTAGFLAPAVSPSALADQPKVLVVCTHVAGDFSTYRLRLVTSAEKAAEADTAAVPGFEITEVLAGFDPQLADVEFCFKVECPLNFSCPPASDCPPPTLPAPPINYLAKDYGSFRQIILDRLSQLLPDWAGSSEADLGVALAELIAYVGDHLSYRQDAIATEAYLETARLRTSLRRHALLVDYHISEGCNARTWVQVTVAGTNPVFLDRTQTRFYTTAPGMPPSLAVGTNNERAAIISGVQAFEAMHDSVLYPELNQLSFYTWGDTNCCLPCGATEATLLGSHPNLQLGDVLIFQEVIGPQTGNPADADLRHRCAVRLTAVATQDASNKPLVDQLFLDGSGNPKQVTEIQWAQADALPFPVCISSTYLDANGDAQTATDVSIVLGNIVLADHGLTFQPPPTPTLTPNVVPQPRLYYPPYPGADRCQPASPTAVPVRYGPTIPDSPLTQAIPLTTVPLPRVGIPVTSTPAFLTGGPVALMDSNKFACLTLQADNPSSWPQCFGIVVTTHALSPLSFDLAVVYNPPGGAAGISTQVVVEKFTNLTEATVASQINSQSQLIRVTAVPPAGPLSPITAAPTMLANAQAVKLQDTSTPAAVTYLTVQPTDQPTDPTTWPQYFAVQTQSNSTGTNLFDLTVVYDPPVAVGVTLPVAVEKFTGVSLVNAATIINQGSQLVTVQSFAQAPLVSLTAYDLMNLDANTSVPAICLTGALDGVTTAWTPEQDLLESGELDPAFVVEVETDGTATLRFGDNINGMTPQSGTVFTAVYRIGNGTAGNVGPNSLVNFAPNNIGIQSCTNPLPATGGTDPETNDQIRRRAPQAFLTQERAVTMADYDAMTELNSQVDRAAASLRWTGSWYTAFIAVEPNGGGNLTPTLAKTLKQSLERYRMAGQDLVLDSPQYVSLEIELTVCVDPYYFNSQVQAALAQVLSNRILPNGQKGVFYPDNFTFGQTVYLSPIYAAARSIAGVVSVSATTFQPQGVNTNQYLNAGEIPLAPLQVARLDNDPSYPNHGQLTLNMEGGK
jgi:Baseplate J-like protein